MFFVGFTDQNRYRQTEGNYHRFNCYSACHFHQNQYHLQNWQNCRVIYSKIDCCCHRDFIGLFTKQAHQIAKSHRYLVCLIDLVSCH